MAGLRGIVAPKATVTLTDGQMFTVSGLTPNHVFGLYHRHRGQVENVFDQVVRNGGEINTSTLAANAETLLLSTPLLMAEIVALGAGGNPFDDTPVDPDVPEGVTAWQSEVGIAAGLPLPIQIDALQKIAKLSFSSDMPPKKFLAVLAAMIRGGRAASPSPRLDTSGA